MKYYWKTEIEIQLQLKNMKTTETVTKKFAITATELKLKICDEN